MPGSGFPSENPWESAPMSLWRHQSLDPSLHAARARVAEGFAKEHVLETAIHEGRIYGLGQQHYRAVRRHSLRAVLADDGKQGDALW